MPVSCDPADLVSEAACIDSCVPINLQTALLISIFCRMAEVSCDSADLMENAKCISTCIPPGMQNAVLVWLACQILNEGGGGGGGGIQQVYHNAGEPNGAVTVTTALPCICIDSLNGLLWSKFDGVISNTGWTSP